MFTICNYKYLYLALILYYFILFDNLEKKKKYSYTTNEQFK